MFPIGTCTLLTSLAKGSTGIHQHVCWDGCAIHASLRSAAPKPTVVRDPSSMTPHHSGATIFYFTQFKMAAVGLLVRRGMEGYPAVPL